MINNQSTKAGGEFITIINGQGVTIDMTLTTNAIFSGVTARFVNTGVNLWRRF
jgi:hypothetical protein